MAQVEEQVVPQDRGKMVQIGRRKVNLLVDMRALGLTPSSSDPDDDFRVLRGERVNLSLQVADTPVTARDQMHLDLYSDDQEQQVQRLVALGAVVVRHHEDPDDDYVVMADPEGNEFCVCLVSA